MFLDVASRSQVERARVRPFQRHLSGEGGGRNEDKTIRQTGAGLWLSW